MLDMRPSCECCAKDLDPSGSGAWICSFECTFCSACAGGTLAGTCPNCRGVLVPRPPRAKEALARYPASSRRVENPQGCRAT